MSDEQIFPVIETPRLVMKKLSMDYLEPVFQHFADDEVNKLTTFSSLNNHEEAAEILQWGLGIFEKGAGVLWGIFDKTDDTFFGTVNYVGRVDSNDAIHRVEIGYDLNVEYWGKGYMTEAVSEVIPYIFSLAGINRIEAEIYSSNTRSCKVVERQGFHKEAVLREYAIKDGEYWDMLMYSLLKKDWEKS